MAKTLREWDFANCGDVVRGVDQKQGQSHGMCSLSWKISIVHNEDSILKMAFQRVTT